MSVTEFIPFKQVMERMYRKQTRGLGFYFAYSSNKVYPTFIYCGDKYVGEVYSL